MKSLKLFAILSLILVATGTVHAAPSKKKRVNLTQDFESLGDNQAVVERARELSVNKKVQVVQDRIVDRNLRLELSVSYSALGGGDSYLKTQNLGGALDFHITPQWSVGARYYHSYNDLTKEGKQLYDNAETMVKNQGPNANYIVPQTDAPLETTLGVVNWYPFYGKLNLFDMGVAHFDMYLSAGYGRMQLESGATNAFSGGLGVGFWWTQHFTTRAEINYLGYRDLLSTQNRQQEAVLGIFSVGVML